MPEKSGTFKVRMESSKPVGLWNDHRSFCLKGVWTVVEFAGVIVDVKAPAVDRLFHYRVPPPLRPTLEIGHRVLVPFGRRRVEGYVIEFTDSAAVSEDKIRDIDRVLDPQPVLDQSSLATAHWMACYYQGFLAQALQHFLPPGTRYGRERAKAKTQLTVEICPGLDAEQMLCQLSPQAHRQRELLSCLMKHGNPMPVQKLLAETGAGHSSLSTLEKKGFVRKRAVPIERKLQWAADEVKTVQLTDEQQSVIQRAWCEWEQGKNRPVLLHGVTGSGKTEVYLRLLERILRQDRQAIVLIPEIALTPQTVGRFRGRFGDSIAVLHSGLSWGERYDQWHKIRAGQVSVAIGARSAIFAPFQRLGLIIIDEEHETTYKQEEGSLKYHARDTAIVRAQQTGAHVVLGSATPSLESYQKAVRGEYLLSELSHRVEHRAMPRLITVDMREEFMRGNRHMFSRLLKQRLQANLDAGHQSIVFLNRRGFASFMLCRQCGHVLECPNCKVSLTQHRTGQINRLSCHYCGLSEQVPQHCPQCQSTYLRAFGSGTQQAEAALRELFPSARLVRMDADTTRRKGSHQKLLDTFRCGDADILIGTQMIAKGLDFPMVTLVGVLSADLSLNFPDFRAGERTFQLLTQVSGRSGRGAHPGDVVVQCYEPNHHVIEAVKRGSFRSFFRREIRFRREAGYPPEQRLSRVLCSGPEEGVIDHCRTLQQWFQTHCPSIEVVGPSAAPLERIKGRYRWHLLLRYGSQERLPARISQYWPVPPPQVSVSVDVEPLLLL